MQESMRTEEMVKRLRDGDCDADGPTMDAAADRLETILKAWEAIQNIHDADWMQQYAELRRAITGETE